LELRKRRQGEVWGGVRRERRMRCAWAVGRDIREVKVGVGAVLEAQNGL
jgi:hypothetical protein